MQASVNLEVPRLVFVVGVGRSGTSLLQSMLAAHSKVAFLPETSFVRRYVFPRTLQKQNSDEGSGRVVRTLEGDVRVQHLGIDCQQFVDSVDDKTPLDLGLYLKIVKNYSVDGASFVGDKDPRLVELLPLVHTYFPDSFVIHMVRDPRDVLVSKQKASWSRSRPWWQHAFANRVQFDLGQSNGHQLFAGRYHVLVYEKLLSEPQNVLSNLCGRLGIPYENRMLSEFGDAAKRLVRQDELQWKHETTGPLLTKNTGKWRDALSPFQLAMTERLCQTNMRFGEYESTAVGGFGAFAGRCFGRLLELGALFYRVARNRQVARAIRLGLR